MVKRVLLVCCLSALIACGSSVSPAASECGGFVLEATGGDRSFTPADLVAHASAMGMTQQETETLLYLEGISNTVVLREGQSICIDGRPDL